MIIKIGPIEIDTDLAAGCKHQFRLGNSTFTFKGFLKVATTLPDNKELPFVSPSTGTDAKGNPTTLTGKVNVTVSDPTILSVVQPDPTTPGNPNSGVIVPVGPLGSAQVKFEDDTDGSSPLIALVDVQVVSGPTVNLAPPTLGPVRDPASSPIPAPGS